MEANFCVDVKSVHTGFGCLQVDILGGVYYGGNPQMNWQSS
jgi:hypothetical protein